MNDNFNDDLLSRAIAESKQKENTFIFDSCKDYKFFNEMFYKIDIPNRVYPNEVLAYAEVLIEIHNLKLKNKFDLYDKILDLMVEIEDAKKNQKLQERSKELELKYEELIKSLNKM